MTNKPFSLTDSVILYNNLETALQIRKNIFETCLENKTNPLRLPKSVIPTAQLYDLAISYEAAIAKLAEVGLIAKSSDINEQLLH